MPSTKRRYIWQQPAWPAFTIDHQAAGPALANAHRMQGVNEGKAQAIGIERDGQIARALMEDEVIATAAIEGETLDPAAVRSSVLRGLGLAATAWVVWFTQQYALACERSSQVIDGAIEKARFWARHAGVPLNERQRKVVQRLLDDGDGGFLGGLNAEKYVAITGTSKPSATRDLEQLVRAGLLWTTGQGRALRYHVDVPGWTHGVERAAAPASRP